MMRRFKKYILGKSKYGRSLSKGFTPSTAKGARSLKTALVGILIVFSDQTRLACRDVKPFMFLLR